MNAVSATLRAPKRMRSGPSSTRCWTSDNREIRQASFRKNRDMRSGNTIATVLAGMSAMIAIAAYSQINTVAPSGGSQAPDDAQGNLRVPNAYRATYQSLGSWAVAADQGQGSKELHVVYASPGAIDAYRKDGHFPDNTVLVKEVYQAATTQMTTGTVSHAD